MSVWSDFRDSALTSVGIPTGIDFASDAPLPPSAVSQAGAAAGNGVIDLATNAFSNLFRPSASVVAGTPAQATANTVAKVSMPLLLIGGVVLLMLLRKKR